ncbi:hypothetical protein EVJ50_06605 [Synechococcus sp. RSCCF101]|nr:hypothetical protein EVJ50_06605 [Synechococcus sp. RSCCF101]
MDVIRDFTFTDQDRILLPGVSNRDQLRIDEFNTTSSTISVDLGSGFQFAVVVQNVTASSLEAASGTAIIIGATADDFLSQSNPDFFLSNPNLWSTIS